MIEGFATGIAYILRGSVRKIKSSVSLIVGVAISVPAAIINFVVKPYALDSDEFAHLTDTSKPMDRQRIVMAHNSDTYYGSTTLPFFSNQMKRADELILTTPVNGISLDVYILPKISNEPVINHGGIAIPGLSQATIFEDSLWQIKAAMLETNKFIVFFIENYIPMKQIDSIFHKVFGDMLYTAQEQGETIARLGRMPSMDEAISSGNMVLVLGIGGRNFIGTEMGVWNSTYYKHPDFNIAMGLSEDRTTASILGSQIASSKVYTDEVDGAGQGILFLDQLNPRDPRLLLDIERGGKTMLRPDVSMAGDVIYVDNIWARSIAVGVGVFLPTYCIANTLGSLKNGFIRVVADSHKVDHVLSWLSLSEKSRLLDGLNRSERRDQKKLLKDTAFNVHVKELGQLSIILSANIMMLGKMSPLITRILSSFSVAVYPLAAVIVPYLATKFNNKKDLSEEEILEVKRKISEEIILNDSQYKKHSTIWLQRATLLGMFLKISTIAKVSSRPIVVSAQSMAWIAQLGHAIFDSLASYKDVNTVMSDIRLSTAFAFSMRVSKEKFLAFMQKRHRSLLAEGKNKFEELLLNKDLVKEFKLYMFAKKVLGNKKKKGALLDKINEQLITDIANGTRSRVWSSGAANTLKISLSMISLGLIFPSAGYIAFFSGIYTLFVGLDVSRSISRIQAERQKFKTTEILKGDKDKDSFKKENLTSVVRSFTQSNLILALFALIVSIADFLPSLPFPFLILAPMFVFSFLGYIYTRFSEHFSPIATTIIEEERLFLTNVSKSVLEMSNSLSPSPDKDLKVKADVESSRPALLRGGTTNSQYSGRPIIYMGTPKEEYDREVIEDEATASVISEPLVEGVVKPPLPKVSKLQFT